MKAKTIKQILGREFNAFVASIKDERVKDLVEKNTIITGGCIASMLLKEKVNDFDLYFTNLETTQAVAEYFVRIFREKTAADMKVDVDEGRVRVVVSKGHRGATSNVAALGPDEIEDVYEDETEKALEVKTDGYEPVFVSTNAITLSNRIQIILRFYGEPDELHANYDFAHCTNYWTSKDGKLVLRPEALEALLARELRYVGSKYPLCSIMRLRKFIKRGWSVNAGQILKMAMQLNELNLTDPKVLEDQLTGVDSAYFCQIIELVKERNPEKVNTAYLVEIIDRMF